MKKEIEKASYEQNIETQETESYRIPIILITVLIGVIIGFIAINIWK